jgi:orotate phosphoribosyltransferase
MTETERKEIEYSTVAGQLTERFLADIRHLRNQFLHLPDSGQGAEDGDRLFAAQIAVRLIESALKPLAVHDTKQVLPLFRAAENGAFKTNLSLEELCKMVADSGAILKGHFRLLSGRHSEYFFMFSRLAAKVEFRKRIAHELVARLKQYELETVIAPITAGSSLVQEIAGQLGIKFAFFEVDAHSRPVGLRRGYVIKGRTGIVNDVTTTGQGIDKMRGIIRENGAQLTALGLVVTRGTQAAETLAAFSSSGIAVESLAYLDLDSFPQTECAQCRRGLPYVDSFAINK